ncbi:MAG: winged helix-turn-helix transcriptional regulator [Promethearchaeia archaeon]
MLNKLQEADKISYKDIGDFLDLAPSTVHNRVQNLIKKD